MPAKSIWLRSETKANEHRTPLTPSDAKKLIDAGFKVTVEEYPDRCFDLKEYEEAGCTIARANSWTEAPVDTYVLGLKEIDSSFTNLNHTHIHFAHCFKDQDGWKDVISTFTSGGGRLLDLEFLVDENGRRVVAFGPWAGTVGTALGLLQWSSHYVGEALHNLQPFPSKAHLLSLTASAVQKARENGAPQPRVFIMGAMGRCGKASAEVAEAAGAAIIGWDLFSPDEAIREKVKAGGPYDEVVKGCEVFVNAILLQGEIRPFLTRETIMTPDRTLRVIADVSCDPNNPKNPIPIYDAITSHEVPFVRVLEGNCSLDVIAIDNLPSMLPREASEYFSGGLYPHLAALGGDESDVWKRAEQVFSSVVKKAEEQ
eukprot:CAMPEP_0113877476 /NCGR_PEP_ID=MMETSP0780_2-20120614/6116_1 /TAXON_ID=652834 /ORGANISM="Palpitomonas bilix" /LENGTH=370 /DNA_ID=CAMNT_0000863775 /DNA_START=90 /DNA_END=1202 /DNA_ORIENTATION=+ /assembly_acc=CAM_ASM_000599